MSTFTWIGCKQAGRKQVARTTSRLADHYGIFKDLFPMAYFVPRVTLRISYVQDSSAQVHYGNHLMPKEMSICWIVKGSVCTGWLGTSQVGAVTAGEDLSISGPDPCQGYWL
ncbi:uncharacterized protein LOC110498917 isoform X4 [Oncorhynchus mykiss]|uniref:uncharacterized protein LOC110498917 isoform X4 n=1 Tax=Oncorhynchus mykiss TaxID=8022 RepID=UPI001877B0AC|nr:uncharacterized protein LOC110498917 isoform X4 [Oncorhynchus mykiss]